MTMLTAIRDRFSASPASPETAGDGDGDALPFAGYDRLDEREVVDALSDHSQVELEAVEDYERSHKDREPVLDKLRYMRQSEPLHGYDALSVGEIQAAVEVADLPTIRKVRGYERKFANRADILEQVARVHVRLRASEPAAVVPAYQPMSASSSSSASADRPDGTNPA